MSKTTTVNAIPYPEDTDAPDGPAQIKALAELLDTLKWGSRNLAPTVGMVNASGGLLLTESAVDVPGAVLEITPAVASKLLVVSSFRLMARNSGGASGSIWLDGVKSSKECGVSLTGTTTGAASSVSVPLYEVLTLTAAKHTIKLRAQKEGTVECTLTASGTGFLYVLVAS